MMCWIRGGYPRHPCPCCIYNRNQEAFEEHRDLDNYCISFEKLLKQYRGNPTKAEQLNGVEYLPLIKFRDRTLFSNCLSSYINWIKRKLNDRIALELLGDMQYRQLQDSWIIPSVGPPKRSRRSTPWSP